MKELSIEEKAKAYDEAIKKAEVLYKTAEPMSGCNVLLETVFPELAESEDEKIRKALINGFNKLDKSAVWYNGITNAQVLAWLERQGEQESVVVIPKFRVGDVIRPKGSMAEYTIESISGECYHGKGWGLHISRDDDYELVEQKPAWSEEDKGFINDLIGIFDGQQYQAHSDEEIVKWLKSIRLPYNKEWDENDEEMLKSIIATCELDCEDRDSSPARHLLQMQTDWLKSLKDRVQSKQERTEEEQVSEEFINTLGTMLNDGLPDMYLVSEERIKKSAELLFSIARKQLKNKMQEWSDEDERHIDTITSLLKDRKKEQSDWGIEVLNEEIAWLKSIKDRIQPQQEKEEILKKLEEWLDEHISNLADVGTDTLIGSFRKYLDGKLPVKPKSQWKPSGFHLECIEDAISLYETRGINAIGLKEVLDELKKLREE